MTAIVRAIPVTALVLAACVSYRGAGEGEITVPAEPQTVAEIVATVFAEERIPVSRVDANTVESGPFLVEGQWGRERVEDRVECEIEDPAIVPVELRVTATIMRSFQRTLGAPPGAPTSRLAIRSDGRTRSGTSSRCELAPSFVQRILDTVAFRAGRGGVAANRPP